jgi:hypothetical protein
LSAVSRSAANTFTTIGEVIIMNRKACTLVAALVAFLFSISAQADAGGNVEMQATGGQKLNMARSNDTNGVELETVASGPATASLNMDAPAAGKSDDVTQLGAKGVVCEESM